MMRAIFRALFVCVLTIAIGPATVHAQSPQANPIPQQNRQKRQPNQVPDQGRDDTAPDADGQFDKAIDNARVTVLPDGTVMAELDDTFMEVVTVQVGAKGAVQYGHATGFDAAARAIRTLPSRPLPQAFPILEEKE